MVNIYSRQARTLAVPIFYKAMDSLQVFANISWGTPAQMPIRTLVDTGGHGFWVSGRGAIVNSGSIYLDAMGPCNQTVSPTFDWRASTSYTGPYGKVADFDIAGGNFVTCPSVVNDTMNFAGGYPFIDNIQVAVCDFIHLRNPDTTCDGSLEYPKSIMGLAQRITVDGLPKIHQDILRQGRVSSSVFSMWFDAAPQDINKAQMGTILWGAVPKNKYTGDLVTLRNVGPDRAVPGFYYIGLPEVRAAHIGGPADKKTSIPSTKAPECVLASGTWSINLPTPNDEFLKATGLEADPPNTSPRYPTACADIPLDAGFELVFKGQDGKSEATVKIPFRSLAVALGSNPNTCRLNLRLGDSVCYLGGPFYSSAFVAHDNDAQTIQIAQGAVAGSAQDPPAKRRL